MRILIFNWKDPQHPQRGGAETFVHEVARRWVSWGHDVTQFGQSFAGAALEDTLDGVRIVRRGNRLSVYREAARWYRSRGGPPFDVVVDTVNTRPFHTPRFVHSARVVSLIFQLAAEAWNEEARAPVSWVGRYVLEPQWLRAYRSVPTLTISSSTKEDLERLGFRRVSIVDPGSSVRPLPQPPTKERDLTLIFAGRLVRTKRPDDAVEAYRRVRAVHPQAKLWVLGDGYLRKDLERGAPAGITFHGWVDEETKLGLMRRAHVLIVPGVREGFGLVVIEANAMGTPAVGYRIPGLRDAIRDGVTGRLVTPDPEALAEGVAACVGPAYAELQAGALQWAQRFDWDRTAAEMLEALEERGAIGAQPR